MADFTLAAALQQSRDNLLQIAQLAITDVSAAYAYTTPQPNTANIFELLVTGYNEQLLTQTTQRYTFNADLRLRVDKWLAGYDGQTYMQAAWQYLPAAAQYFVEHRGLNNPSTGQRPPFLDPANTHVGQGRIQVQGDELWVTFSWVFVYSTVFLRCGL